jgi:thioredoxin-related protein
MKKIILSLLIIVSMNYANNINLNQLVSQANKNNKHLLVFLHITGCNYCLKMKEWTFDDDNVIEAIKKILSL